MITTKQMKAARALLGWDQIEAAARSGLSVPTIQRMETLGLGRSSVDNANKIRAAFEAAGIEFQDDGAPGVRLHPRAPSASPSRKVSKTKPKPAPAKPGRPRRVMPLETPAETGISL